MDSYNRRSLLVYDCGHEWEYDIILESMRWTPIGMRAARQCTNCEIWEQGFHKLPSWLALA